MIYSLDLSSSDHGIGSEAAVNIVTKYVDIIIVFGRTPIYSNIAIQLSIYVVHAEFKWVAKNDPALSELTSPLCAL